MLPFGTAWAVSADEIIANNVAARGGAEQLHALRSLERKGRLVVPGTSLVMTVRELRARPGEFRQEYTLQGLTQIAAWDGREGWRVQPFEGRKDAARMPADEANALKLAADLDGPLVDYRAKGHKVEYLGTEDIEGTPAHKLRVRLAWGDEVSYWIDPETWMVLRSRQLQFVRGAERVVDTDYGEYEKVGGVYVAMSEESGPKDSEPSRRRKVIFESAAANVDVGPDAFAFPAPRR
jgi:hypothetical protein